MWRKLGAWLLRNLAPILVQEVADLIRKKTAEKIAPPA